MLASAGRYDTALYDKQLALLVFEFKKTSGSGNVQIDPKLNFDYLFQN